MLRERESILISVLTAPNGKQLPEDADSFWTSCEHAKTGAAVNQVPGFLQKYTKCCK